MASPKNKVEADTYTCLIDDDDGREAISKSEYSADVLPSNTRLAGAPIEMIDLPRPRKAPAQGAGPRRAEGLRLHLYRLSAQSRPADPERPVRLRQRLIPMQCELLRAGGSVGADQHPEDRPQKVQPYLDIEGVVFTMFSVRST